MKNLILFLLLSVFVTKGMHAQLTLRTDSIGEHEQGIKDDGISPSHSVNTEVDYDKYFTKVEIMASFPGGEGAWKKFLKKNLIYPKQAIKEEIQGTIVVQLIVNKDSTAREIKVISGPEELRQAAVDVVKKVSKWAPAKQNGREVSSSYKIPIVFRLDDYELQQTQIGENKFPQAKNDTLKVTTLKVASLKTDTLKVDEAEEFNQTFTKAEIMPSFPGGDTAWQQFVKKNIVYPAQAKKEKIQGIVMVQMIVNKDGASHDIDAIYGPKELQQAAVDVVKKVTYWEPAQQNGRKVKCYTKVAVKFQL